MKTTLRIILTVIILHSIFSNANAQWQSNGPYGTPGSSAIYSLAVTDTGVFAGTNTGLFLSVNNGATWSLVNLDSIPPVFSLLANGSSLYAGTFGNILRSPDNGRTWSVLDTGINQSVGSLAISGSNIYAGTWGAGLFMSTNDGQTWAAANNGLPLNANVSSLAVIGSTIVAGTWDYGIYTSTNNGATWDTASTGLPNYASVRSLAVNGTTIYACVNGYGVYVSTNNGATWATANNGLTGFGVYAISMAVTDSGLFVATLAGLYRSTDNAQSWSLVPAPINNLYLTEIAIHNSTIFVGTDTNYVWQRPLAGITAPASQLVASVISYPVISCGEGNDSFTVEASSGVPPYITYATTGGRVYSYTANFDSVTTLTGLSVGNYTVVVKDMLGDSVIIDNITLRQPVVLTVQLVLSADTLCGNQTASAYCNVAGGTSPYGEVWSENDTTFFSGDTVAGLHPGYIRVVISDSWGCTTEVDTPIYACAMACSAQFTLYPDTTTPHHYYALNQATGTGNLSYVWYWGDGDTSSGPTPTHTYADSGYYTICLTITDTTGCTSTYCDSNAYLRAAPGRLMVTVDVVTQLPTGTGITPVTDGTPSISIYPNPASNQLIMDATNFQPQWISIYDMNGRKLSGQKFTRQLDVSALSAGLYFIEVKNENTVERGKFVKM